MEKRLSNIKSLCFDVDNVIFRGSEYFKTEAWEELFEKGSEKDRLLREARQEFAHGKGDRYDMIGAVYGVAGLAARDDVRVAADAVRFDQIVQSKIVALGLHSEDEAALEFLADHFTMSMISNTPEAALTVTIMTLRDRYPVLGKFDPILGTPTKKPANLEIVRSSRNLSFVEMVMIGDGRNDLAAAEETGCHFVGVTVAENEEVWARAQLPKITSVSELPKLFNL